MVSKDELARAIGAHGLWKTRLKQTIGTGRTAVRQDNQCAFGKRLHAGFLKRAARVADLAPATLEWKKGLV